MKLLAIAPGADLATIDVYRGYIPALRDLGHEVLEYDLNSRLGAAKDWLRTRWRRADSPKDNKPNAADIQYQASREAVLFALWHQPDWVLVFSAMYFSPDALVLFRRAGIRVALLLSESPYDDPDQARVAPLAEAVFTNERSSVAYLQQFNTDTFYLPHAYNPALHFPQEPDLEVPAHDVVFVGTGFMERLELLDAIDWDGLGVDLGLYGTWELLPSRHRLRKYIRGGVVTNQRAAQLYCRARIGLNLYRQSVGHGRDVPRITHAESLNPRAYELAACGVFQISDHRAELDEMLPGLPTFETPAQLEYLVQSWLRPGRAAARWELTENMRRCILPHAYARRAALLVDVLEDLAGEPDAASVAA